MKMILPFQRWNSRPGLRPTTWKSFHFVQAPMSMWIGHKTSCISQNPFVLLWKITFVWKGTKKEIPNDKHTKHHRYLKKPTQAQFCIACLQAQCVYRKKTVLSYLHGKLILKTCLLYFIYIFFICFCKIARNCSFFIGKCGSRGLSRDFYDMRKMKPQCINW